MGILYLLTKYFGNLCTFTKGSTLVPILEEICSAFAVKISKALKAGVLIGLSLTVKLLKQVIPSEEVSEIIKSKLSKSEVRK